MTDPTPDPSAPVRPRPEVVLVSDGRARYWLTYYMLVVTRRRRPFFADDRVRGRCRELLHAAAAEIGCELATCEVYPSSVVLEVRAPPTLSPQRIATRLRHDTAAPLKGEFPELERVGAVFARPYAVSTVPTLETERASVEGEVGTS